MSYRSVKTPENEWFIAAWFDVNRQTENADSKIRSLLKKRNASQPIGLPSCGSVFKNPSNGFAAQMIEAAGFKGEVYKSVYVSGKHANFIISDTDSKSSDIEELIALIQRRVHDQFGVMLETEVRFIGETL